jgi:Flp pilus assembly protein TadD
MSKQSRAKAATSAKASALSDAPSSPGPNPFFLRWGILLAGGIVVLAALAAYANSFSGALIWDDKSAIADSLSIRHLGSALFPPPDATTGGRPLLNFTFALNYALGGLDVRGYHVFNLLIHALAGLTLFGIVRRTLTSRLAVRRSEILNLRFEILEGTPPTVLALAVAVIWVVHPLQTEAVAYLSQRAESLMGLFYLLTLYCFVRGAESRCQESGIMNQAKEFKTQNPEAVLPPSSGLTPDASRLPVRRSFSEGGWFTASILACLLGALSKEVIVTAPVMVFLYDRTFVAGSFREAWRLRWKYYLGLAATWLLLAHQMSGLGQRAVGYDEGATGWTYALTSCRSAVLYLKLAVWPHPLVFDYGNYVVQHASEVTPYGLVLAVLLAGTAIALWRWPVVGFAGAWIFLILAPTTSIVPVAGQPMAEHRMYLPLAAVIGLIVLGLYKWIGRRSLVLFAAMAVGLGWLTIERNQAYRSRVAIWGDTVAKQPDNARAYNNLGNGFLSLGQLPEATTEFQAALRLDPDYADAHYNLGRILVKNPDQWPEAIAHLQAALQAQPDNAEAHSILGSVLMNFPDRLPEAMAHLREAVRIKPDFAVAHYNLAGALAQTPAGLTEAIAEYEAALQIEPGLAQAHTNLAIILANIPGRLPEAIVHFEAAVQLEPDSVSARENLRMARQTLEESQAAPQ